MLCCILLYYCIGYEIILFYSISNFTILMSYYIIFTMYYTILYYIVFIDVNLCYIIHVCIYVYVYIYIYIDMILHMYACNKLDILANSSTFILGSSSHRGFCQKTIEECICDHCCTQFWAVPKGVTETITSDLLIIHVYIYICIHVYDIYLIT